MARVCALVCGRAFFGDAVFLGDGGTLKLVGTGGNVGFAIGGFR